MRDNCGFTLIEVLLALVILSLVFSGFSRLVYGNLLIRQKTNRQSYIVLKTADIIEYLKTVNYPEAYSGEYVVQEIKKWPDFPVNINEKYIEKISVEIQKFSGIADVRQISVEVISRANGDVEKYSLITLYHRKGG